MNNKFNELQKKLTLNGFLLTLIIILFLALCLYQINKPILHEQIYYLFAANSIIHTGVPIFGFDGYNYPELTQGIGHPPVYLYTLLFFIKLFGFNYFGFKFSGIFFTILTSILLYFTGKLIFKENKIIPLLASFLYLIHPFVIQSALFVSIDPGVLTFLTLSFIYLFLKYKLEKYYLLTLISALILWTKFSSFIVLIGSVFVYCLFFGENKKRNISLLFLISIISAVIFLISFYIYTNIYGLSFFETFRLNSEVFSYNVLSGILLKILRSVYEFKNFVIWLTLPLFLYLIYKLMLYLYNSFKRKLSFFEEYALCFFICSLGFFTFLGLNYAGFAKHFIIMMPLLSLVFADDIANYFKDIKIKPTLIIFIVAIFLYLFFIIKDPIYLGDVWKALPIVSLATISLILPVIIKSLLILIPLLFVIFYFKFDFVKSILFYSLIFMLYSTLFMVPLNYSTNIYYGDTGLNEAINYLEQDVNKTEIASLIVPHQIAFYWNKGYDYSQIKNNAYLYSVANYYIFDKEFFKVLKISPNNTYLIIYEHNLYRTAGVKELTDLNFDFVKQEGTYLIYKIKKDKGKLEYPKGFEV